jgi:hypothetical protein
VDSRITCSVIALSVRSGGKFCTSMEHHASSLYSPLGK